MIIYKVTNLKNNKIYIGQTINSLEYRRDQHIKDCRRNKYYNNKFHNALLKYGYNSFKWEIIHECFSIEELNEKEIYYISLYNSVEDGYNLKYGGNNGGLCSTETKLKIGQTTKSKWNNPEIANKMLNGLRKGVETMKLKGQNNFEIRICPICNCSFKCKLYENKCYCSIKCASKHQDMKKLSIIAAEKNRDIYNSMLPIKLEIINNWIINNKTKLENVKMNRLSFLQSLCSDLQVKDMRTVAKILGLKNRKELVIKLQEISKNIC